MSSPVDDPAPCDATEVQRLLREGASLSELDVYGKFAMYMAVNEGHTLVVKCLIKEGGSDIDAVITSGSTKHSALLLAFHDGNYVLAQCLIKEGALIPSDIWWFLKITYNLERADAAELSSFLKVVILLPMSPDQDKFLPAFLAELSPQHAELCTRGRQLRDRLPAYLEQQQTSICTHLT
jgi:ankyrin repeat protein